MKKLRKYLCFALSGVVVLLVVMFFITDWHALQTDRGLLEKEYTLRRVIEPEVIVQYGDFTSYANLSFHERILELDTLYFGNEGHLYLRYEGEDDQYWGVMEKYTLSERMKKLVGVRAREAYISRRENDMFLLLMRDSWGRTLLAYGWEDVSERDDVHSDDTRLDLLCVLKKTETMPHEFYNRWYATEIVPESITVERYIAGECVGTVELTDAQKVLDWYRQTRYDSPWEPGPAVLLTDVTTDSFLVRWNYSEKIAERGGVSHVEGYVVKLSESSFCYTRLNYPTRGSDSFQMGGGDLYAELAALFSIT